MPNMTLTTMVRGATRFNMVGQALPHHLSEVENSISPGLATRLRDYAVKDMVEQGFGAVIGWDCEVSTMDGDAPPSERYYVVRFTNQHGGQLGIQGIMTGKGGWPTLDHGIFAERSN